MNLAISLGRLKFETEPYRDFVLTYDDPLTPLKFSIQFNHMAICLSASPYISLRNDNVKLCLSHVKTVRKHDLGNDEKEYIITCYDHSLMDTPIPVKFFLKCSLGT